MVSMIRPDRGAALIEVLIAGAVRLIIMATFASQLSSQLAHIAYLEDKLSQISLDTELKGYLNVPTCMRTFNGLRPNYKISLID